MFSVPAIFGQTPAQRNERRMRVLMQKIDEADASLSIARTRLGQMRESLGDLTDEDMAGLDYGQCQNLGNTTGRFLADVQRSLSQAQETFSETLVAGAGFEAVL